MSIVQRNRIKQLLRETFWQWQDEPLETITPKLIRYWAIRNLHPELIEATAINLPGADFWDRVEQLCILYKQLEYWLLPSK